MPLPRLSIIAATICIGACATSPSDGFFALQAVAEPLLEDVCPNANVSVESVRNPHVPDLVDRIETKNCVGASVRTYISTAASDPTGLPMSLELSKPNPRLPHYMNIGQAVGPLVAKLGTPSSMTSNVVVYSAPESEDSVTFNLANDRVVSIRWDWYVD